jgi:hypothetical protein
MLPGYEARPTVNEVLPITEGSNFGRNILRVGCH